MGCRSGPATAEGCPNAGRPTCGSQGAAARAAPSARMGEQPLAMEQLHAQVATLQAIGMRFLDNKHEVG